MGLETPSETIDTDAKTPPAFDRTIDWLIGVLLGIVGTLVALGGLALRYGISRPEVATLVHRSEFDSDVLTEAEAIDALVALGEWSGVGLVVTGGVLVLIGVAVVIVHGRARRADRGTPGWILGVVGALVGSVLSFIPLSPILGGATAGYLDPNPEASGLGTGGLAGVFGSLPLLVLSVFAGVGVFRSVPGEVAPAVFTLLGIVVVFSLVYFVGLSALGGYIGGWVRDR